MQGCLSELPEDQQDSWLIATAAVAAVAAAVAAAVKQASGNLRA
jgi:hypothetical protein